MTKIHNSNKGYDLSGTLELSENEYTYRLKNGYTEINLSQILKEIYKNNTYVYIKNFTRRGTVFSKDGKLYELLDENGINSLFINGKNLDKFLFNNTNEFMNMSIVILDMEASK